MLCCVVPSEGSDQERFSFMPFKTLKARPSVRVTTLLRKVFNERSVIAVHIYRCFVVWCRAKETNVMAARTDFIDELL